MKISIILFRQTQIKAIRGITAWLPLAPDAFSSSTSEASFFSSLFFFLLHILHINKGILKLKIPSQSRRWLSDGRLISGLLVSEGVLAQRRQTSRCSLTSGASEAVTHRSQRWWTRCQSPRGLPPPPAVITLKQRVTLGFCSARF